MCERREGSATCPGSFVSAFWLWKEKDCLPEAGILIQSGSLESTLRRHEKTWRPFQATFSLEKIFRDVLYMPNYKAGFSPHLPLKLSSVTQSCPTLCDPMNRSMPGLPVHHQLPESTQTHVHRVGDTIQPSHPLSPPSLPALSLSQHQGLFQWVSSSHQVAKYWSFSFNIGPSIEHPELSSFRMDWLDLLAGQGTLKSLLQHHSSEASVLRSDFFIVQLSHPCMTTGKTIALTRWTFVGKVSLLKESVTIRLSVSYYKHYNYAFQQGAVCERC